ncbi:MalY/PatB family protein [Methanosphaera sp. ISO3-F5]|uniref:MalY/PatB family protein n=1 Tax=Methanosphaera sp. ISO3-F5 TaxID=1452353 RepID=UPI002B258AEA|nr:MalY/PatB family protein [Methanosphaera sp. ISO3-F5]WQH64137.1 pyridoxal phosphate-dependent aminotransferase [Methanosphaera sp. ISO3-F5]
MKYDFDTITDRRNTNSVKWDYIDTQIPMWVADMDFKVAPEIQNTLNQRVNHGIYGYTLIPDEYYESYINWWKRKHNFTMNQEEIITSVGVMPSISSIIRELTEENDTILIQTPVYHVFFYVIQDNNRKVLENQLEYDGTNYSINFEDLEEKLSRKETKMMILCNPHNPIGKIWNTDELQKIDKLCKKHEVILISDEIHCDLVNPGKQYIPFETITTNNDNIITCMAPTKTFNIAGIQSSIVHIPNKNLYDMINTRFTLESISNINLFAIVATITAFNECEDWLKQLNEYIYQNKLYVDEYLKKNIPQIKLVPSEATYLLWLDCTKLNIKSEEFNNYLNKEYGVYTSPGKQFGDNGDKFLRLNVACPREMLKEALNGLKEAIYNL